MTREGNDSRPLEPMAKAAQAAQEHLEDVADGHSGGEPFLAGEEAGITAYAPLKQAIDVPGARCLVALLA